MEIKIGTFKESNINVGWPLVLSYAIIPTWLTLSEQKDSQETWLTSTKLEQEAALTPEPKSIRVRMFVAM